tara:strand:+ start:36 stop:1043 length:1008 start_codon:yes stop_codon:yes gene_type:complete
MITQGLGEVLTDALTVNPALAELPSASAILDASNYTFQAVTFGKDAQGFQGFHAHAVVAYNYVSGNSALGASSFDLASLVIDNAYGTSIATSSYVTSAVYNQYSGTYNSVPNYPMPSDTRLERGSTKNTAISNFTNYSGIPDLGHYLNPVIDPTVSAAFNKIGGYAFSGPIPYVFYNNPLIQSFVGTCSSYFNANALLDSHGYLTISPSSVTDSVDFSKGAIMTSSLIVSSGQVAVDTVIASGDAATLAAFGGVKHVGVYCLDLKEMLASGLLPPYGRSTLNNTRKYRLVAKVTSIFDILFHRDWGTNSGFERGLNQGLLSTEGGPRVSIIFDFN